MDTNLNEFLIRNNGFVYATLYIKPLNDVTMLERSFLLDTGASATTMSLDGLTRLGYTKEWVQENGVPQRPYETASKVKIGGCYKIRLPQVTVGNHVCLNFHMITSLESDLNDLLGINFIRYNNWIFDYEEGKVSFRLIKTIVPQNSGDFGIHTLQNIEEE